MQHSIVQTVISRLRDEQALSKLVGRSAAFLRAIDPLPAVAQSDATVLVTGETGTGKELVAHAIHYLSARAGHAFSPVNCGSLPDTLLEDELFGHEAGAFTDARSRREGLLSETDRGTLFLDEIDSLTPRAQVAFLRLLEDRTYRALGSSRHQRADVRFVAACNTPLEQLVRAGAFRSDLYYRLSVVTIRLPPLRERKDDIPLLAERFLEKHTPPGNPIPVLAPDALAALLACEWPGNVRELESVIVRGILLGDRRTIRLRDLAMPVAETAATPASTDAMGDGSYQSLKRQAMAEFERQYLTRLMTEWRGNVSQAARAAGKERRELGKLLKKHQLDRGAFLP
jgi:two-component system, NtrC family, response regulator GlrR